MFKTLRAASLALILPVIIAPAALAEPASFFQVEGVEYDPTVTTFEAHAGYEIGERVVRYGDLLTYVNYLAETSDRIAVETIGRSHQGRPILQFTISSPENLARIDDIREAHLARLQRGRTGLSAHRGVDQLRRPRRRNLRHGRRHPLPASLRGRAWRGDG